MDALSWIGQLIEALSRLIPRLIIVRATHVGVKWRLGNRVSPMLPGVHFYWPLLTEIDVIVAARQTLNLSTQALTTKDGRQVAIGALVVYRIKDVVRAIGARNWDVDTTIADIAQAAVTEVIACCMALDLQDIPAIEHKLTNAVRRQLKRYGVSVQRCAVTDCTLCRTFKVLGESGPVSKSLVRS
jgi:regulator of protease activity HflC (stomatin/prohibitin superfamily)